MSSEGTPFCKLKYFPFCQCDAKRSKLLFECKVMPIYSFHLFRINPTKNSLENHQCVKNKYLAYEVCMNQISYMVKVMRSLWTWKCYSNIPDYENEPLLAVKEIIYNMKIWMDWLSNLLTFREIILKTWKCRKSWVKGCANRYKYMQRTGLI